MSSDNPGNSAGGTDLGPIVARAGAATAGPWQVYLTVHGEAYIVPADRPWPTSQIAQISAAPDDYGLANADFIAHARHDILTLLDEVRQLRQQLANAPVAQPPVREPLTGPMIGTTDLDRTVGRHECDTGLFDRTVCPEPCGTMHSHCTVCGARQDPCAHDTVTGQEQPA